MANRITTAIDFVTDGANRSLAGLKAKISETEGATGKLKAGWGGVTDMFKNSAGAQSAAIAAGTAAIGYSINAASDLAESINAVDVSYGEAAEGVHELGKASAETLGMSERAFNTFAVQFSAFAQQIAKESGRDVVDVLDEITTRTADFASVNNLAMEEAGTIVMSTLAGETEAFRRYGGDVSAATVKTYAYTHGIAEAGDELTEQQKVLARYGALMEQTDKVAGDFANTSDGLANQQRITAARTEDLAAALGTKLTPIAADALQTLNDLADAVASFNANSGGSLEWLFNTSGLQGIEALQEIFGGGTKSADMFGQAQDGLAESLTDTADAAVHLEGATKAAYDELGRLNTETANVSNAQEIVQGYIDDATEAMEEQNDAARDLRHELRELTDKTTDLYDAELDLEESIKGANEVLADEETTLRKARDAMREVATDMDSVISKQVEMSGLTLDSVAGQEAWVIGMLQSAETLDGPLRDAVLGYISEVSGIPKEVLTQYKPEMDYAALAAIEADLAHAARTRFVRFAPSGTQGGAVIDGPNTGPRGATPNDPLGWAAAAAGPPIVSGTSFSGGAGTPKEMTYAPVTNIYNAVNVQPVDAASLMYDLDRMAKGLG